MEGQPAHVINRERIFASFDGSRDDPALSGLCLDLLAQQKISWPLLRDAYAAQDSAQIREISANGFSVKLQFNPRRIISSAAAVDPASISRRPCFLCVENLPEAQKGILYRQTYLILCNPAPIFSQHYVVSNRRHIPQSIEKNMDAFLLLAKDFGSGLSVFYNGPRCGASAPDHLHFHVVPSDMMPIEKEIREDRNKILIRKVEGVSILTSMSLSRPIIIVEGKELRSVETALRMAVTAMQEALPAPDEPMMNLLCAYDGTQWRVLIIPRRKHRPEAYYREGDERILISPGMVDMGGLIITPVEKDFNAIDAEQIGNIFKEVSMDDDTFAKIMATL
jgi:diadenosine tetraphosphate (Ap4A) HIT family hydrolase